MPDISAGELMDRSGMHAAGERVTGGDLSALADSELVRRTAQIEPDAFEVLVQRHSAAAFALARSMLGSQCRAEDAVQEAFMGLWRGAVSYDGARGSVRSWLLCIVRNRSIDTLRRLDANERRRIAVDGLEQRIAAADEEMEAGLVRREGATVVRGALATLPPDQRRVLELAYYGGWTQAEIAAHLGVPLGTVKGRTRLGLTKLRAALGEVMSDARA